VTDLVFGLVDVLFLSLACRGMLVSNNKFTGSMPDQLFYNFGDNIYKQWYLG
jgi:hypothetical protein